MTDQDRRDREEGAGGGAKPDDTPSAAAYAGLGLQLLVAILLFLFVGQWLDRRFGTDGILTVAGVLIGAGAAIYGAYRRLMADQRRQDENRRK